jgi:hypothetical protein
LPLEGCKVVRGITDDATGHDAGVVDEDVDAAETLDDRGDEALDLRGIGLIGLERRRPDPLRFDFVHVRRGFLGRYDVAERDVRTFVGQSPGDRCADAARSARDQGDFAGEVLRHLSCSVAFRIADAVVSLGDDRRADRSGL